jgi:hypothetical protein
MVAILNCRCRNEEFEQCVLHYPIFKHIANREVEFIELYCMLCKVITQVEKNAVKRDGNYWKYV